MHALLRVTTGQRAGQSVALRPGEVLSIGRSSESDLQLLDLGISRFHCVIEDQADGLLVTDLSSSNGTFVNGQRVKRQPLSSGDKVQMGPVVLVVDRVPERRRSVAEGLFTEAGGVDARTVRRARVRDTALVGPPGATEPAAAGEEPRMERTLAALYKINAAIISETNIGQLLAAVMDTVLEGIQAERGFLLLVDGATGELRQRVVRVLPGSAAGPELPLSLPLVHECMEQGDAVLCSDLMAEERSRDGDAMALDHIRSVLCAPLDTGGKVAGVIYLDSASEGARFDEDDLGLLTAIARQVGLALHRAQLVEDLERVFVGAIEMLVATVEAKDIYTYGHSARVSKLARQLAEAMGLPEGDRERIKIAGLLHDIGKIGIPESILTKAGKLTGEEWEYVRSHPAIGESIIRQMGSDRLAEVEQIVRHHHERTDGSGYPDGLEGDAIPLGARVLAVADAYDAMTSNRPYRTPFTAEAALAELRRNAGQQFDARAVEALVRVRGQRPAAEALAAAPQES